VRMCWNSGRTNARIEVHSPHPMDHRYTSSLKGTVVAASYLLACVGLLMHSSRAAETPAMNETAQLYLLGLPPIDRDELRRDSALAALGSQMFNDARLSASGTISCATCHEAISAFTDGRATPIGVTGRPTTRNAPTLLNVRFEKNLFWDGRESRLESQAVSPLMNPVEHGLASEAAIIEIVLRSPEYVRSFAAVLGKPASQLKLEDVGNTIAAFERTLLAGESRFDPANAQTH
jgi:cytochrome c peroxidase